MWLTEEMRSSLPSLNLAILQDSVAMTERRLNSVINLSEMSSKDFRRRGTSLGLPSLILSIPEEEEALEENPPKKKGGLSGCGSKKEEEEEEEEGEEEEEAASALLFSSSATTRPNPELKAAFNSDWRR